MYTPANPNLQTEAQKVLDMLKEISGQKIILGQHTQTMGQEELSYIKEVTGRQPLLCGFELLSYSPNIRYETCSAECLKEVRENYGTLEKAWEWAEKGGLVTFTWHWFSCLGGHDKSFYSVNTEFDVAKAVIDGTKENEALLSDMKYMAGLLRPFSERHVPVLWRPFHECDGDYFWWGKSGAAVVKKLYRIMFELFCDSGLDNLIWVFNASSADCYVGDDLCDIVSKDMYPPEHEYTTHIEEYNFLHQLAPDKLCAIGETGTLPDFVKITSEHIPYVYCMTWSKEFCTDEKYTDKEMLKRCYENENTLKL